MKKSKLKKINLGCGNDYRSGYTNIDIRSDIGADLVHDITKPFPLASESVKEAVARDVFEHLTKEQQTVLFSELHRLLSEEGKIYIRIPNNDDIWDRFSDDPETRNLFLFGDTSKSGPAGAHKSGHTLVSFLMLAARNGFAAKKIKNVDTNYEFEFIKSELPKLKGIVFINQTLGMGGAESFMSQLLYSLQKNKIPVQTYTTLDRFNDLLKSKNIYSAKIPFVVDLIGDWKGFIKGFLLLPIAAVYYAVLTYKNRNKGTILMSGYIEKILVTPWAKFLNIPVVWIEYGPWQSVFTKFFGFPKILYRLVSRMPDFVIEPSENTRIKNINPANLSTAKTKVIPCGIVPLDKINVLKNKYSVYSVSRMEKGKGQDLLIKSWPDVLKKFPKAKLYLIGEGDFRIQLEKLVRNLHLENSVNFLGWVSDISKTVSGFNIGVFPSVWELEGFGIVLLEAMSLDKPIICFNKPPYNEIVDDSSALLIETGNIKLLSQAVIKLFRNENFAKKLGNNARVRFNKKFKIDQITRQYEDVLLDAQVASAVRKIY